MSFNGSFQALSSGGGGGGPVAPAYALVDDIGSVVLNDPGGSLSTWSFAAGLWTATANGSSANHADGFTDADVAYADIPVTDLHADWDPNTHDLFIHLEMVSFGTTDRTANVGLIETNGSPSGQCMGFVASATPAWGIQLTSIITVKETIAGLTDLVGRWSFATVTTGGRVTVFAKISGTYPALRSGDAEDSAAQTGTPADYAIRVSSGVRATGSSTDTLTFRIYTASVLKPPLP